MRLSDTFWYFKNPDIRKSDIIRFQVSCLELKLVTCTRGRVSWLCMSLRSQIRNRNRQLHQNLICSKNVQKILLEILSLSLHHSKSDLNAGDKKRYWNHKPCQKYWFRLVFVYCSIKVNEPNDFEWFVGWTTFIKKYWAERQLRIKQNEYKFNELADFNYLKNENIKIAEDPQNSDSQLVNWRQF